MYIEIIRKYYRSSDVESDYKLGVKVLKKEENSLS